MDTLAPRDPVPGVPGGAAFGRVGMAPSAPRPPTGPPYRGNQGLPPPYDGPLVQPRPPGGGGAAPRYVPPPPNAAAPFPRPPGQPFAAPPFGLPPQPTPPQAFTGLPPTLTPPLIGTVSAAALLAASQAGWASSDPSSPGSPRTPGTPLSPLTPMRYGRRTSVRRRRGSRGGPIRPDPATVKTVAGDAEYQLRQVDAAIHCRALPPLADKLRGLVETTIARTYPGARVEVFGSCASNLAAPESDVDLVAFGHAALKRGAGHVAVDVCRVLEEELGPLSGGMLRDFAATPNARVPVVSFSAAFDDGSDRRATVDLTFGNAEVIWNSKMLREFGRHAGGDARRLLRLVRLWARHRRVSTVYKLQTPSPYAHCLLVATFLVQHGWIPQILRDEKWAATFGHPRLGEEVDGLDCTFEVWPRPFHPKRTPKLPQLVHLYFAWLANVDTEGGVVSLRKGGVVPSKEVHWLRARASGALREPAGRAGDEWKWRLSIEDPFAHAHSPRPHDLGDVLNEESQATFFREVRRAERLARDAYTLDVQLYVRLFRRKTDDEDDDDDGLDETTTPATPGPPSWRRPGVPSIDELQAAVGDGDGEEEDPFTTSASASASASASSSQPPTPVARGGDARRPFAQPVEAFPPLPSAQTAPAALAGLAPAAGDGDPGLWGDSDDDDELGEERTGASLLADCVSPSDLAALAALGLSDDATAAAAAGEVLRAWEAAPVASGALAPPRRTLGGKSAAPPPGLAEPEPPAPAADAGAGAAAAAEIGSSLRGLSGLFRSRV